MAQERLTTIDRRLAKLVSPRGTIEMPAIVEARRLSRPHALARLDTLEQLRLVDRTSPTSWRVAKGWRETLQQLGQRGDIIKRMHQDLQGRASSCRVFEPGVGAAVEGVIKQKRLHDELAGDPYVIVQTARMEAVYVRKLGDMPIGIDGRWVFPEAVIEVNQRRLARLERYNLVARLPDGTWRVPPNLVDVLRSRERSHPQFRVQVEPLERQLERSRNRGPSLGR